RAALRILESESLITIARGVEGGPRVHHPDIEAAGRTMGLLLHLRGTHLREFFFVRSVIEPTAAYLFAERRPSEGLDALESILAAEEAVLHDQLAWAGPPLRYYRVITDHCGNDLLAVFGAVLQHLLLIAEENHMKEIVAAPWLVDEKAKVIRDH